MKNYVLISEEEFNSIANTADLSLAEVRTINARSFDLEAVADALYSLDYYHRPNAEVRALSQFEDLLQRELAC